MPLATISDESLRTLGHFNRCACQVFFHPMLWKGLIMSGRKWWECNKDALLCLCQLVRILQETYPCVQQSPASDSSAEGGWWTQCSSERSWGSNDWCMSTPWTTSSGNFFTSTLFHLLFLEGKQLRRGVKGHPELLFSPVAFDWEWRVSWNSHVKTGTEVIFLSVPDFALLTVSA